MKKLQRRVLLWLLTITMLVPMLSMAAGPAFAANTSGTIGNMDMSLTEGLIAPSEEVTFNPENGGGIRFATSINLAKFDELKAFCKKRQIKVITVGTLIAPVDYVKEAGMFTKDALDELGYKTAYLDFKANTETFYEGEGNVVAGYDEQFVASIMNIKLENRTRDFAAIGYVQLTLSTATGGKTYYTIYSYDTEDMKLVEKYAANIAEVAEKELQKDSLTEEERAMLTDLATEEEKLSVSGTNVKDIRVKRNQVFFTYTKSGDTFYNRITYDGANGWRLQSNTKNYNSFKDIGAGQSLAMYMQEGFHDVTSPLTVTPGEGKLIITAAGTDSCAQLSYDTFDLDFCDAEGESLYNVNGMAKLSTGKIKMTGKMTATEAVYGGGERFDSTNQRGKSLDLYIADAYDLKNITATYVAIPLFSTSRGGGMFINRYEPMTVSFPQNNMAGNWTLTLDAEIADCYFYATGEIADVLQAYVDLTGHASLPEEWAQGYIVCRFAPDLVSLGGQSGNGDGQYWYYNIEDIPDYSKYSYSIRVKMTIDNVFTVGNSVTVQWRNGNSSYTLKNGDTILDSNDKKLYTYVVSGSDAYFQSSTNPSQKYNRFAELPSDVEYYLGGDSRDRKNLEIGDVLPHKKALTQGGSATYFHYIIEGPDDDFNYNGIKGESYFLRTSSKGGPSGAGIIYVVDSLIKAGMKPTGVILEGVSWYDMNSGGRAKLEEIATYLQEKDIKTLVYSYLGWVTGASMGSGYKSEYLLSINVYEYDTATGEIKLDENGNPILKKTTTAIPKVDKSDNPDTASDGTQNYLDITNPDAVKWYIDTVWTALLDLGIDGVKIDFCESIPNEGYYKEMKNIGEGYLTYNWYDPTMFESKEVHHAYPSFLTSVLYAEMEKRAALRDGDTGFVLLTRGGGIGSQRNPYMWAGDQTRRFRTLALQLNAVINSGISGLPFMSYDMAGYAYYGTTYHYYGGQPQLVEDIIGKITLADQQAAEEYESEIFVRGLQYTVFGNLIQTHGDVRHVYYMTEKAQEISALYASLHEELSDYQYKLSQIACDTGMPMIRHMILEYQDDANVASIDDQFMYGDGLLVAPILTANSKVDANGKTVLDYASVVTRQVYLPEGEWMDLNSGETINSTGEYITVEANLAKIPVYLNLASADAEELQAIFAGETWTAIKALANAQ